MDGLSRVLGIGPSIVLGGRRLSVRALKIRHLAEAEAEIIAIRGNPFDAVRAALHAFRNEDAQREFARRALLEIDNRWRTVSSTEIFEWYNTTEGRRLMLWQLLEHNGVSREWLDSQDCGGIDVTAILGLDEISVLDNISMAAIARREREKRKVDDGNETSMILLVRFLVEEYRLTFEDVGELTLRQLNALCVEKEDLKEGVSGVSQADLANMLRQRGEELDTAADNLIQGRRWDSG